MRKRALIVMGLLSFGLAACSSGPEVKQQKYAKLSNAKEFEEEYPIVWKAALDAMSEYKIESKEMDEGEIRTDWIYSTSNDKYFEYKVNGFPRKKYLQIRFRWKLKLEKMLGKVRATATQQEEIENINRDGSFDSWKSVADDELDTQRANELIQAIEGKILSRPDALDKT